MALIAIPMERSPQETLIGQGVEFINGSASSAASSSVLPARRLSLMQSTRMIAFRTTIPDKAVVMRILFSKSSMFAEFSSNVWFKSFSSTANFATVIPQSRHRGPNVGTILHQRGIHMGQGVVGVSFDFRISKRWKPAERFRLEGAVDTFNLFNTKNLKQPQNGNLLFNFDGTLTSGVGGPRQSQLGVKLLF